MFRALLSAVLLLLGQACSEPQPPVEEAGAKPQAPVAAEPGASQGLPNILLIVLDDVAFTDLGIFGGEIGTPNLDSLAREGVVLTNFHVTPNCSPTRAMLLSGSDNHIAGLGNMAEEIPQNQAGKPGYEGYLNFSVAALPEVLQEAGYHTYMTGKWHLGLTEETSPAARGFEKSFAMLQGGAGAFDNMLPLIGPGKARYREDGRALDALPEGFYSTRFYTKRLIEYIESNRADDKPFFGYLAHTSAHWPLQAPQESINRYRGRFDRGYDVYQAKRLARLKELGFVAENVEAFPRLPGEPAWEELSEEKRKIEARMMEIYAAMISDIDLYLGKLLDYLKETGELQETFIFVMADNGPEGHHLDRGWEALAKWVKECCDNSYENMGKPDSYLWYGQNWAQAGNTPRRMYKGFTSQGGVHVPAFAWYPRAVPGRRVVEHIISVMDVMPTLLEVAGIPRPGRQFRGREVVPMQGRSLLPLLRGDVDSIHGPDYWIGWELFSKRAVRRGDWKLLYEPYHEVLEPRPDGIKTDTWQLYNLAEDPRELNDLSAQYPDKLAEMKGLWEQYARDNNVILPDHWSGY